MPESHGAAAGPSHPHAHPGDAPALRSRAIQGLAFVLSVAYAWWVATTTPFTAGSYLAVSVGFVPIVLLAIHALLRRHRAVATPTPTPAPTPGPAPTPDPAPTHDPVTAGSPKAWMIAIGLFVVLELVTYIAGFWAPRHAYPTTSSLYDQAATHTAAKAAIVWAWLALGWGMFRR
jgi:hypothetical protein